jgi:esterase/lipase
LSGRTLLGGLALVAAAVVIGGVLTKPAPLLAPTGPAQLDGDAAAGPDGLEAYLAAAEADVAKVHGIVDGSEKRIRWHGKAGARSGIAVVYLHGFSATRQEINPIPELVARSLDANLFETRLHGHGRERERMSGVNAEDWLADGVEALTIGAAIGERLLIIGTSTGATLALALAEHPLFERVDSLVFISPNWGPAGGSTELGTGPYGPQLVRLIAGEERSWTAANEEQERYWTTRYPTSAIVEMLRLVKLADRLTERATVDQALLIYSPSDDVVSVPKLLDGFERLPVARKEIERMDEPRSLSTHVLAGRILAPEETQPTVARILAFMDP